MASIPSNIPPIENFEDVRRVLASLITSINSVFASLPPTTFNGQRLTRVGLPVSQDDAATKGYVDQTNITVTQAIPHGQTTTIPFMKSISTNTSGDVTGVTFGTITFSAGVETSNS